MRPIETKINRWDGGMTNLLRGSSMNFARRVQNFDILSDPTKMSPYPDFATDTFDAGLSAATVKLCKYLAANNSSNDGTILYGLGVAVGQTYGHVYLKSSVTGTWVAGANDNGTLNENLFVEYQGRIYLANATQINSYSISAGTINNSAGGTISVTTSHTDIFQGLVHSKSDILYIPYYTTSSGVIQGYLASKNGGGAFNITALTLPQGMIPIRVREYGNYVIITCKAKNVQSKKSVELMWDQDSSLTTLSEKIDWGFEQLEFVDELDGLMVGVGRISNTSSETITVRPKLIFKYWAGGSTTAKQFLELPLSSSAINNNSTLAWDIQKVDNRILFLASVQINGTDLPAIWAIGRKADGTFSVSIDRLINNDTAITSCIPKGFLKFGDYYHVAFTDNGTYKANVTINGAGTYSSATAIWESVIMGEPYLKFKLMSIGIMTEPLPAAGQITLQYAADSNITPPGSSTPTTWTTIFSWSTDDELFHEAVKIESTAAEFPEFREIQFRIQSTGGAVVTGFWAQAEQKSSGFVNRLLSVIRGWL